MRDKMIRRWDATGLPTEARLREALQEIALLHEEREVLKRRIHNQRLMLRRNWEIIEMRAQYRRAWYPSKLLMAILNRGHRGNGQLTKGQEP